MIVDTINACDVDIKKELYSNILLTGTFSHIQVEICYLTDKLSSTIF